MKYLDPINANKLSCTHEVLRLHINVGVQIHPIYL